MREQRLEVALDIGCLVPGSSGGLVSVVEGVLPGLFERCADLAFVVYGTELNRDLLPSDVANLDVVTLPSDGFYAELNRRLADRPAEVLFRSFPTVERLSFPPSRQVVLVPDLLHESHPQFFESDVLESRWRAFRGSLRGVAQIATISESARATIVARYGPSSRTFIMYPALPRAFASARAADATADEHTLVPEGEFLVYPANIWPHKNHERLLRAARRFRERSGRSIELVFTGALDGARELLADYHDVPARHLGYVSAPLLRLLYERATALAFFSLHEGFGLPILEAFEVGTPVLCSACSSLPEVAGDAALMCDPTDVEMMADLMLEISANAGLRDLCIRRGKERARAFRWSDAADQLGAAIERVGRLDPPG